MESANTYFTWRGLVMKSSLAAYTKLVLHTLHGYMNDAGESCYPSIETIGKDSGMSKRAVILHLKIAAEVGFIEISKHGFKGRKWSRNDYKATFPHVPVDADAVKKATEAVTQGNYLNEQGGDFDDHEAVTQGNSNYPVNYPVVFDSNEPKTTPRAKNTKSENPPMRPEGMMACRLIKLGVKVTSMHPTLCKWVAEKIPIEFIEQCVALARQHKPAPEGIAANYLDSIIRSELKPKKPDKGWLMSDEATQLYGESIGVYAKPGESWADYRQRVLTEHEALHEPA